MATAFDAATAGSNDTRRWGTAFAGVLAIHVLVAVLASLWRATSPPAPPEIAIAVELAAMPSASEPAPAAAAAPAAAQPQPPRPVPVEQPVIRPQVPVPVVPVPAAVPMPVVSAPAAPTPAPSEQPPSAASGQSSEGRGQGSGSADGSRDADGPAQGVRQGRPDRGGGDAAAMWRGHVQAHLDRHKRYPPQARMMKREGRVHLHLTLDRQGRVLSANVERPTGFKPLDTEALETVRRADPLPTPPAEIPGSVIPINVPIGFYMPGPR